MELSQRDCFEGQYIMWYFSSTPYWFAKDFMESRRFELTYKDEIIAMCYEMWVGGMEFEEINKEVEKIKNERSDVA